MSENSYPTKRISDCYANVLMSFYTYCRCCCCCVCSLCYGVTIRISHTSHRHPLLRRPPFTENARRKYINSHLADTIFFAPLIKRLFFIGPNRLPGETTSEWRSTGKKSVRKSTTFCHFCHSIVRWQSFFPIAALCVQNVFVCVHLTVHDFPIYKTNWLAAMGWAASGIEGAREHTPPLSGI